MAFSKSLNGLLQRSKNCCGTNIGNVYKHKGFNHIEPETLSPDCVDITPDFLLLAQGVYEICLKLKAEIETDSIVKHMISGVKHPMIPFPYCFTDPSKGPNLSFAHTPTLPRDIPDVIDYGTMITLSPHQVVFQSSDLDKASVFFIETCRLAHELCDLATLNQNIMTPYGVCVTSIMTMVVKHLPRFSSPSLTYISLPPDHVVYLEVFLVLIELTFALYSLVVSFLDSLKHKTFHQNEQVPKTMEMFKGAPPVQTQYMARARDVLTRHSHNYAV
ncbi:protein ORF38 [Lake sturgeon herpesvirus]|nr:protein ORF38 [Lake sturgeon herpesvirus]